MDGESIVEAYEEDQKIAKALKIARDQLHKAGYTEEELDKMSEWDIIKHSMDMDYACECALEYEKD